MLKFLARSVKSEKLLLPPDRRRALIFRREDFVPEGAADPRMSRLVDRYRKLYLNLFRSAGAESGLSLAVTSAGPGEGKTTVAANLAIAMAVDLHRRVLLVDADFSGPTLARLFSVPEGPGLEDYLVGRVPLDRLIHPTGIDNLSILSMGDEFANPLKWLDSPVFDKLRERLSIEYDLVIWDTPAVLDHAATLLLLKKVGTAVLVAKLGQTRRVQVAAAVEAMDQVRLLGFVPNYHEYWVPGWIYRFL